MTTQQISMRDAFGQALLDFADAFSEMVVLDADVSSSTKTGMFANVTLNDFSMSALPKRIWLILPEDSPPADCVRRQHICSVLALKCADQVRNVLCYNNLPVVLAAGYAGLSDSYDGASHQSLTDLAVMRAMPNDGSRSC
jgi:transketolase